MLVSQSHVLLVIKRAGHTHVSDTPLLLWMENASEPCIDTTISVSRETVGL